VTLSRFSRIVRQRLRSLFRASRLDAEVERELALHFDALVEEHIREGVPPDEARRAARIALGGVPSLLEQCRDHRRLTWLHDLRRDVGYGLRMLRKHPAFTAVAIVSLALGIGANTAVLGVMSAVAGDSLPLPHVDRLVVIKRVPLEKPTEIRGASAGDYLAWKERSRTLEAIDLSLSGPRDLGAEENGLPAERSTGQSITPGFFSTLGVQPFLGRTFSEDEARTRAAVVVISYRLWQRRYGGDPQILNKPIRIDRSRPVIVGVMPEEFSYWNPRVEFWTPTYIEPDRVTGAARLFGVVARLKPAVTIDEAQRDLDRVSAQLARERPELNAGWGVRVQSLRESLFGWTREPLVTLGVAVALVLLIACANVAALLLARASVRGREIAMRVALGAGRPRIVRQLLTESVLLSIGGGLLGLIVAWWGVRGLAAMSPPIGAPAIAALGVDVRMLAITGFISLMTGVIFGLGPALAASEATAAGPSMASKHRIRPGLHPVRTGLVVTQIALALVLLIGFGLLTNSFVRLTGRDLNFDAAGLLTFEFRTNVQQRPLGQHRGFGYFEITSSPSQTIKQVHERLQAIPGAESVAGSSFAPVDSLILPIVDVAIERASTRDPDREAPRAAYFLVTPNFFATMRTAVLQGREVTDADTAAGQWVAVINETAARRFWPGENPIGRRFTIDVVPDERPREVIGVVGDIPTRHGEPAQPVIYASYLQQPSRYGGAFGTMFGQMTFMVRHAGDPLSLVPAVRRAVAEIEPRPIAMVMTAEQRRAFGTDRLRYNLFLFGVLACTAALLAAVGIYGLLAYSVNQRTQEIGIRKALGASPRTIVVFIARYVLVLVAGGLLLGVAGALALTRLIASQLWGITPTDPSTYAAVSLLLAAVAAVACIGPLRRALAVDPTVALRSE
jgi:putative ABC transport system permease protein